MRFFISTIGLALLLSGCGGGGGGDTATAVETPVTTNSATTNSAAATPSVATTTRSASCVVKALIGADKYRSAIMDMRFEQPNDFTADGKPVASYDAVVRVIDKIDCVGFDTVVFQTNVPIDVATGNLALYDSTTVAYNRDKNIPKDFWRIVEYTKNKGLKVIVKAIPVNHHNDVNICPGCTGPRNVLPSTFSTTNFFNTLSSYHTTLAREAEKYRVDGYYIGVMNLGLDTTTYIADWDRVIAQVKTVYTGKLIYEACSRCTTQVWDRVDLVAVHFGAGLADAPSTTIASLFNDNSVFNFVVDTQRIATLYRKPILLDTINIGATGKSEDLNGIISGRVSYTSLQPNYALQSVKIATVFELIGSKLPNQVVGVQWSEYMPWSQASWIQKATNVTALNWQYSLFYGFDLLSNESAQKKLSEYFSEPWGHTTVK
jgi:hypothetical protein